MTYSIVARDPETGELGGAVQSHWFATGTVVLWGEAGIGVVATQALGDASYGPLALRLLRDGYEPRTALEALIGVDPQAARRQVGVVDARGRAVAHTGERCIPMAGHRLGPGYSTQANLMERDTVWGAMAEAFEAASGGLADRLLAALRAAQEEGGDLRGSQSAALVVVAAEGSGRPWEDRTIDLRVDDHERPLDELERLVRVHRGYRHLVGDDYRAAEDLVPGNPEIPFWHAVSLAGEGRVEEALPLFRRVFEEGPGWVELVIRLGGVGMLEISEAELERILELGRPGPR